MCAFICVSVGMHGTAGSGRSEDSLSPQSLPFTLLEMGFLTAGCQEGHTRWPRNFGAFTGLHLLSHHRSSEMADELRFAHHDKGNGGSDSGHHAYMTSASNH